MNSTGNKTLGAPHLPQCPPIAIDGMSLVSIRETVTALPPHASTEQSINSIIERWRSDNRSIEPIQAIRGVLESIRQLPRGDDRLSSMNTFVRTLGRPDALATFLDMLRDSATRAGTSDEKLTRTSRNARKHAVYGWAGQTLLLFSGQEATDATLEPEPGVRELLGAPPEPAVWGLSMHIWQPNPNAKGFPSGGRISADTVVEPPHSHPFDFASMVSIGVMHQSIYQQREANELPFDPADGLGGRYEGVVLEQVDGVWPEHAYRSPSQLRTLEASIALNAGDSYYMPCNMIHDVEFDVGVAASTPAITLFLASEAVVKPHVYIAQSMADAHDANPQLKEQGSALPHSDWNAKLSAVSAYLRGERPTLKLAEIVKYDGDYAFFHTA